MCINRGYFNQIVEQVYSDAGTGGGRGSCPPSKEAAKYTSTHV